MDEGYFVKLKLDVVFKRVFGEQKNIALTKALVSDLLEIPRDAIQHVEILNVEIAPEYWRQKFSRLDLRLKVDDRIVNVEMQVRGEKSFRERSLFYWSKLFTQDLKEGEQYKKLRSTICVNILDFNLFDDKDEDYHTPVRVTYGKRRRLFTQKFAIHVFELRKLERFPKNLPMEDWLNLINVESKEELMAIINNATVPEARDAGLILLDFQADERIRQEAWYREKQMHDEASELDDAKEEGREEGRFGAFAGLVRDGIISVEQAAKRAGVSVVEFEDWMKANPNV